MALFLSQTSKAQGGLTTAAVLLGQVDRELVDDVARVAAERAEQSAVTVHDDEAELLVGLEQLAEGLGVELVVAEVERGVDGLEGLEVDVDLALLSFGGDDFAAVDDEAVGGHLVVELEALLGGSNGGQHGLAIDAGLDVGGSALWRGQMGTGTGT